MQEVTHYKKDLNSILIMQIAQMGVFEWKKMKIPFGTISITDRAKELVVEALNDKRVSCGRLVQSI